MSAISLAIELTQHNRIPSINLTQNYVEDIVSSSSSQVWIGKDGGRGYIFVSKIVAWNPVVLNKFDGQRSCRHSFD